MKTRSNCDWQTELYKGTAVGCLVIVIVHINIDGIIIVRYQGVSIWYHCEPCERKASH